MRCLPIARCAVAVFVALVLPGCTQGEPGDAEAIYLDDSQGDDWPGPGRTYGEQHYSPLSEIREGNVEQLGLAWSMDLGPGNSVTQPIAIDGTIFFTTGLGVVRAVDAESGKLLWTYDAESWKRDQKSIRTTWGSRGISWWNGRIYLGVADGRLIALDAKTGQEAWSVQTTRPGDGRFISGASRVFDGKIIIGHGGADAASVRGYVTAYDAETGKQLWRFFLVPGNPADGFENEAMEMAAKTWHGEWWKYGGGGTAWNAMSYDPDTRTVLVGTGNGSPWNRKVRSEGKGDNLFLSSIVALDAESGDYKWHYQTNPGETWDYNAAMDIEFADLTIDGKVRKVFLTAPKNGYLYVIDRTSGEFISAEAIAQVTWAKGIDKRTGRPIENPRARFRDGPFRLAPSPVGAHSWLPMAVSKQTGLVYIPTIDMAATVYDLFERPDQWKRSDVFGVNGGVGLEIEASDGSSQSALVAWDPVHQKEAWRVPQPTNVSGGVMATGGNLVFQGAIDSRFNAYHAGSGRLLWSFNAEAPVIAPPISYRVNGRQYITVLTGTGSSLVLKGDAFQNYRSGYREQPRRLLTFMLGGTATLPKSVPYRFEPVSDPNYRANPEAEMRGNILYSQTCIMCHARDANGFGGGAPDLRASPTLVSPDAFRFIVLQGALRKSGMPLFDDLSERQLEDIRQYLRKRADEARE